MKKIVCICFVALLFASCSTLSSITSSSEVDSADAIKVPAGMEFETYKNYKEFALVKIPTSGNKFATVITGGVLPSVVFDHNKHIAIRPNVNNTEGDFATQFEAVKKEFNLNIKENSTVVFEEKKLGNKNVALIDIQTKTDFGIRLKYGYMVQNGNKAALVMAYDAYFNPAQMEEYKPLIDETFQYIVKTMQFN
jgi:hypothetical protein